MTRLGEEGLESGAADPLLLDTMFGVGDVPAVDPSITSSAVESNSGLTTVPVVSLALMIACGVVFACQVAGGGTNQIVRLRELGALVPDLVHQGEVWRLVSANFLHGNLNHLLGNMLLLFVLGMACEHGFGRRQFMLLYVVSGILGSLCSLLGGRISVGASGAIFGLAGALIALFWRHRDRLHLRDRRFAVVLMVWAGYQLLLGLLTPHVDNLAHLGGLLGGAILGLLLRPRVLDGRHHVSSHPISQIGLVLSVVVLAATSLFFLPRLVP